MTYISTFGMVPAQIRWHSWGNQRREASAILAGMESAAEKGGMRAPSATCSLCGGTGMRITRDAQGDRVAAVCSCRRARQALRRLERANIPRRHEHATLENYESIISGAGESMLHAHFKANKFVEDY